VAAALLGWGAAGLVNHLADGFTARRACGHCGWAFRPAWPAIIVYLRRGGRCPECRVRLALRPLIVELVMPLLFVLAVVRFGMTLRAAAVACYLAVLLLVTVVDLATRRIPNVVVLPASAVALLLAAAGVPPGFWRSLGGGALAFGVFVLAYLLGVLFLRAVGKGAAGSGPALGLGDVKLALLIGLATGYPGIMLALFAGTLAGAIAALGLIAWRVARRRYQPFAAMAYGPYLALGAAVALLWGRGP
jgi:leader peptidase (prepilin peptidase)/N-methyltransferase